MAEVTFAESALPKQADVVIVGAGLAGLFSAHYIERAGLGRVLVLERRDAVASLTSAHSAEGFRLEWDAAENIEMVRASRSAVLRSAWIVRRDEDFPRLTSCHIL